MTANRTWDVVSGPGLTALGLAASRCVESGRPDRLIEDPWGAAFVAAVDSPVAFPTGWPAEGEVPSDQEALHLHGSRYIGVRSRFYDDYLTQAVSDGIRQFVLLAVGLDTRAFRLDWPDSEVTVFELDQPNVIEFKDEVLRAEGAQARCGRVSIGVDLREDWPGRPSELSERSGVPMQSLVDTGERTDCADRLSAQGWSVDERTAAKVAASYGRDLADPFSRQSTPPWLETGFVTGRLGESA